MVTLELHEMIRLLHAVECQLFFILFNDRGWRGGVFKVTKIDHFLVFLVIWVFFPKLLGR